MSFIITRTLYIEQVIINNIESLYYLIIISVTKDIDRVALITVYDIKYDSI